MTAEAKERIPIDISFRSPPAEWRQDSLAPHHRHVMTLPRRRRLSSSAAVSSAGRYQTEGGGGDDQGGARWSLWIYVHVGLIYFHGRIL